MSAGVHAAVDDALVAEAVELARSAGEVTLRWFGSADLAVEHKDDGTPVTAADRAAERHVREVLARRYPDDLVIGEEEGMGGATGAGGRLAGGARRRWVIDPIDGTKAFARGVPLYTTLLAVDDEAGPAVGVIHLPALGETVWAGRGRGCFHDGRRASVSRTDRPEAAYLSTSGFGGWPEGCLDRLRHHGVTVRTWGDGYGYALAATGRVDAMVDFVASEWDLAPMRVLLAEAGGRFTDLTGRPRADGGSGLATNGALHGPLLGLLTG